VGHLVDLQTSPINTLDFLLKHYRVAFQPILNTLRMAVLPVLLGLIHWLKLFRLELFLVFKLTPQELRFSLQLIHSPLKFSKTRHE